MPRRYDQISKAFERALAKDGSAVSIARGQTTHTTTAIYIQQRYSQENPEGFTTTYTAAFFKMRRSDYLLSQTNTVVDPRPGDILTNLTTGERWRVTPNDDGRRVDDTPREINIIRIPVQPIPPDEEE